ncbi:PREDICTED: X-linked retinitis pigmentosa GTPase regulator [Nanorana parkeri]|uniref:X-linked retinitis pigmentosa GTPase regulator n=1 Tax=Nanorana parkeri TaxID=125878 RepID=UPI000854C34C|nr:PREDICTED: X-linked retinitis pigmentosa GTPase regulator [Nanorana parkeri]
MATEEQEKPVPNSGAIFTFGKSKFDENCPSKFWLKNDKPANISCGDEHSVLMTGNGKLYVFGSNIYGQLGIGSGNVISVPTCVKALSAENENVRSCVLSFVVQGKVYSSGWNSEGQLGLGDTTERSSFHEISFFSSQHKIKQLSAGSNTSAALTADGKLFMWGENLEGQLGLGEEKTVCSPHQVDIGKPVSWVSCGYYHSAFVTQDGDLYTFGEPENGKLGLPAEKLDKHRQPQRVPGISGKVKMVCCGGGHTIAVTDKEVYTFGLGQFGQLGHGTFIFETPTPKVVEALKPHRVRYAACGENHTAVITDKGLLYSFGDGRYGKLGLGEENFTNQFSPTLCMNFLKFSVQSVACGGCHMLVFATPRPKESETVIVDEIKENYLMVNGEGDRSTTLQRCPSARVRRREKKQTPDQIRDLTRTLPPLKGNFLESSLPVPSKTVPPGLLKVRQASTESSANSSSAVSKSDEKGQKDLVKSFSAGDDSDNVSRQSFGDASDILNMTHAISTTHGGGTFSPVQKKKKNIKNVQLKSDGKVKTKEGSRSLSSLPLQNKSISSNSEESEITSAEAQAQTFKKSIQDKFRKASEAGKSKYVASQEQLSSLEKDSLEKEANVSLSEIQRKMKKQKSKNSMEDMTKSKAGATSFVASESDSIAKFKKKHYDKTPRIIRVQSHESISGQQMVGSRNGYNFVSKAENTSSSTSSSDNLTHQKFRTDVTFIKDISSHHSGSETLLNGKKSKADRVECFKTEEHSGSSTKKSKEHGKPTYFSKKKEGKILIVKQKESVIDSVWQNNKMTGSSEKEEDSESGDTVSCREKKNKEMGQTEEDVSEEDETNLEKEEGDAPVVEVAEEVEDGEEERVDKGKGKEEVEDTDEAEEDAGIDEVGKDEDADELEDDNEEEEEAEEAEEGKNAVVEKEENSEKVEGDDEETEEGEDEEETEEGEDEEEAEAEGEGEEGEDEEAEEGEDEEAEEGEDEEAEEGQDEEEGEDEQEEEAESEEHEKGEGDGNEEEEDGEEEEEEEGEEEEEEGEEEEEEGEEEEEEGEEEEEEGEEEEEEGEEEEEEGEEEEEEGEEEEEEEEGEEEEEEGEEEEEEEEEGEEEEEEEEGEEEEEEEGEEEEEEEGEEEEEEGEEEEEEGEDDNAKKDEDKKSEKVKREGMEKKANEKINQSGKSAKRTEKQNKNVKNIKKHELKEYESTKSEKSAKLKNLDSSTHFWDSILPEYLTLK